MLTIVVVSHPALTPEDTAEHDEVVIVVTEAGTVVTLADDEVDTLSVVTVANWVAVGVVWHTDMLTTATAYA